MLWHRIYANRQCIDSIEMLCEWQILINVDLWNKLTLNWINFLGFFYLQKIFVAFVIDKGRFHSKLQMFKLS